MRQGTRERRSLLRFSGLNYWPAWLLLAWMRATALLPFRLSIRLHKAMGRAAGVLLGRRACIARRNLEVCFPELSSAEREALLRRHFEALGACIGETGFAWFAPLARLEGLAEVNGKEHLEAALGRGRGVLLSTGHFTGLEVTGPLLKGLTDRFTFMFSRRRNPLLDEIQSRRRSRLAHESFPKDSVRAMLRSLQRNAVVWYAADEFHGGSHAQLVELFGEPAMTNTAISRLARLSGAAVVPFDYRRRENDSGYVLTFQAPLEDFPSPDPGGDARRVVAHLEQAIRAAPEQYLWRQKRFRGRPAPFADVYASPARAPRSGVPAVLRQLLRGAGIGVAELVPGLSGASVAVVFGVYERLLAALSRLDAECLRLLLGRRFGQALHRLDLLFVAPLVAGMLAAPLLLSRAVPIQVLIEELPEMTFGFLFGLIAASVVSLLVQLDERRLRSYGWFCGGIALGASTVLLVPASTPDSEWFLFLCGMAGVTAMLMPGLSGTIVLLALGKYAATLDALARFDLAYLVPFAAGALIGAVVFSRLITRLLARHRRQTMLAVLGLIGGSLLALWPFQEWTYAELGGAMRLVAAPYLPEVLDRGVLMGSGMILVGAMAFRLLRRVAVHKAVVPAGSSV